MNFHLQKNSKGQDLQEFAILLPFTLLFLIVIFDLGRVTFFYSSLNNATREGARFGSVADFACDTAAVQATVRDRIFGIASGELNITVTWNNVVTTPVCKPTYPGLATVTVHAVYCFNPITPFVEDFFNSVGGGGCSSNEIPLDSSTIMYLEM